MKSIIFLSLILSIFENPTQNNQEWMNYKKDFNKTYLNKNEEVKRYSIFKTIDKIIKTHNDKYSKGGSTYEMGHNQFSDMNKEEFSRIYLNSIQNSSMKKNKLNSNFSLKNRNTTHLEVRDSISYQEYCLPPLNQGSEGCSWAFASTAQVEAQLKIKDPDYDTYIAPQYITKCSGPADCTGNPAMAFNFLKLNGLVALTDCEFIEFDHDNCCDAQRMSQIISSIDTQSLFGDEDGLKDYLNNLGPVVVTIFVTDSFMAYTSGILYDKNCPNECNEFNHELLLIGFGTDESSGQDYWLLKNSWGINWGESGYIRMIRNQNNSCNIACNVYYATVSL